jgi:sugar phosphate isomerase/epimerase
LQYGATRYRIADELGARHLNVMQAFPPAVETSAVAEASAGVCDRAAQHGLLVALEFFPWSPIVNLSTALEIVEMANRPNAGVTFDTWHHFRSGGTTHDLRNAPGQAIAALHINDAARETGPDLLAETLTARLLPGEGSIDLIGQIQALDAINCTAPIGVEVISLALDALPPKEAARRVAEATRRVLAMAHGNV